MIENLNLIGTVIFPVMCNIRTNARINVEAQSVRAESEGLFKNNVVSKVAEDGCPAG